VVLHTREHEAGVKAETLALLKRVGPHLRRIVHLSDKVTTLAGCVLEAADPLVPGGSVFEKGSDLLSHDNGVEDDAVATGSFSSRGVNAVGAQGPVSREILERVVGLLRAGKHGDSASSACVGVDLLALGKIVVRVRGK